MAGTRLERLSVMHQRLDGISGLCTGKFLLIRLLAADHRDRQEVLTEICV